LFMALRNKHGGRDNCQTFYHENSVLV
jgi:hypothetical protein